MPLNQIDIDYIKAKFPGQDVQKYIDEALAQEKNAGTLGQAQPQAAPAKSGGGKQACYDACQAQRNAAEAAAAMKPFPQNVLGVAAAILAFNACRKQCDATG